MASWNGPSILTASSEYGGRWAATMTPAPVGHSSLLSAPSDTEWNLVQWPHLSGSWDACPLQALLQDKG